MDEDKSRELKEKINEYDRKLDETHIEMEMYELLMKRAITVYQYYVEETLKGLEERSESEYYEQDVNYWYKEAREAVKNYNEYKKKYKM